MLLYKSNLKLIQFIHGILKYSEENIDICTVQEYRRICLLESFIVLQI